MSISIQVRANASEDLEDAAANYRHALEQLDRTHGILIDALRAAHAAGIRPTALSDLSGLSRMTVRKHCTLNFPTLPTSSPDIPTV